MSSYPDVSESEWKELVVGGSYGEPLLFKLYDTELVSNGSFEDELSGWDGSGVREDFGVDAVHGNYVLSMENVEYMHIYFDRTSVDNGNEMNNVLVTGFIKMTHGVASATAKIRVYASASTTRTALPAAFIDLEIAADDGCMVEGTDGLTQWVRFYVMADITTMIGDYVHVEISSDDYATMNYYLDDLKVFEVKEVLELSDPQVMNLRWQRKSDATYDMADLSRKDYLRGWRPVYTLSYEYCSRANFIKEVGITESDFNFFVPHKDTINGEFVRMESDLDASYFKGKFLGYENSIELVGIYLRKFKNIEYGTDYFTLTEVP